MPTNQQPKQNWVLTKSKRYDSMLVGYCFHSPPFWLGRVGVEGLPALQGEKSVDKSVIKPTALVATNPVYKLHVFLLPATAGLSRKPIAGLSAKAIRVGLTGVDCSVMGKQAAERRVVFLLPFGQSPKRSTCTAVARVRDKGDTILSVTSTGSHPCWQRPVSVKSTILDQKHGTRAGENSEQSSVGLIGPLTSTDPIYGIGASSEDKETSAHPIR